MSLFVTSINCAFERRCTLGDDRLMLDYRISNLGTSTLPFIYSAHPLLAVDSNSRLLLPRQLDQLYVFCLQGCEKPMAKEWVDMNAAAKLFAAPFDADRHTVAKLYTQALQHRLGILQHPDSDLQLRISFGGEPLKYMGVLLYQGFDETQEGSFWRESFVAIEPTTSIGDDLASAIETGTHQQLAGGQEIRFWIQLTVETPATVDAMTADFSKV